MVQAEAKRYRRGDVVLVDFPGTTNESTQNKRRPVVIISNQEINDSLDYVLVVPLIDNNARRDPNHRLFLSADSDEGKEAGLQSDCAIDCSIIATVSKSWLGHCLGHLPDETLKRIEEQIKHGIQPIK